MVPPSPAARLRRDRRGAAAIDFAFSSVPLFMLIFGGMELAWQGATAAAVDYSVTRISRFGSSGANSVPGTSGSPGCRSASIPWLATYATGGLLRADPARLTVTVTSYASNGDLVANRNGRPGAGVGEESVRYTVRYRQPPLVSIPLLPLGTQDYTATTVLRNEPFIDATC